MRDDRMKWAALPDTFLTVMRDHVLVKPAEVGRQYLVSGVNGPLHDGAAGWPEIIASDVYSLRLGRDQSLHVGGAAQSTGWQSKTSQAITDMTDGYQVFDLSGPKAFDVLCRGAELDLSEASASSARQLWGMDVVLYRFQADTTFRLHVARSYAMALYGALNAAIDALERQV